MNGCSEDQEKRSPKEIISFGAGPSKVPRLIRDRVQTGIMNFKNTGLSILETGHRSKEFTQLMDSCRARIRRLFSIPDNYQVLFLQGGATGQFDAIPMNLFGNRGVTKADYLVTGSWSHNAAKEARKYGAVKEVCTRVEGFTELPNRMTWHLDPEAAYLYYCDNETINGIEFNEVPQTHLDVPIVCDMSSNLFSRPVDIARYGLIIAGSQKNLGCPGLTIVIIRNDLIGNELTGTPGILSYRIQAANASVYNTPPTFTAYVVDEMLNWIESEGGLQEMARRTKAKSDAVYKAIDSSDGFYKCPAAKKDRSRLNIVLHLSDRSLESKWLEEATHQGFVGMSGHRSVGGIRISLYNAITMEDVNCVLNFMSEFKRKYS
ncbi:unnamed protein product [Calicophoron daubneyi]|uniref:Phosphoserine aminotransferase n=1 Tax=Calicophoron daubneyi TaxID=300641 RepID=A0AAV2SZE8_CALDB